MAGGGAASAGAPALRVGTSGDYPPFSRAGRGFDVEVARRLAAALGADVVWVSFRWPELERRVAADAFDVAMSGVTWRPERAITGYMTRAIAAGGPCVLGDAARPGARVAVNRGGVLERFARARFPQASLRAVDRNETLGALLTDGTVDAVVTDSFEVAILDPGRRLPRRCEPPADRKVYWVAPRRAAELGPRIDAWLADHEAELETLRAQWLGGPAPRTEVDHLLDLLARRLAYMPAVAASKRARGLPIEDPAREARVLAAARAQAAAAGLDPGSVEALFRVQVELAKQLQQSAPGVTASEPALDLDTQIRPALGALGERIVASAARAAPPEAGVLDAADWTPLRALLDPDACARLRAVLLGVRRSD